MAFRPLEIEGRFRSPPDAVITFDEQEYAARTGEPLAVALLAHGIHVLGRSTKYHRPRGLLCGRGTCGACLARVDGSPSRRLCLCTAAAGTVVESQNTLGSARFDALGAIDRVFAAGLDHHRLMTQTVTLNRLTIHVARRLGGLGRLPDGEGGRAAHAAVGVVPEVHRVQAAVIGAGQAGRAAAAVLRARGFETSVLDAFADDEEGLLGGAYVLGLYDERELWVARRGRQLRIQADAFVAATGTNEQAPRCSGNDIPGLMLRRAAELALTHGVLPGRRLVVAAEPEIDAATAARAARLTAALVDGGAELRAVVGPLAIPGGPAPRSSARLAIIEGGRSVGAVRTDPDGERIECDAVLWCGRPAPAYELPRQMGVAVHYDPRLGGFVPESDDEGGTERSGVFVAGEVTGLTADRAAEHGTRVGAAVASFLERRGARRQEARRP